MSRNEVGDRAARDAQFNNLLLSSIDGALNVLGEKSAKQIFIYFKAALFLKRNEIHSKPEVFEVGLNKLMGSRVSNPLMGAIIKGLYSKLGLRYAKKASFKNYVNTAKKYYLTH